MKHTERSVAQMPVSSILWDYDGTLADSSKKNIEVTLDILRHFIPDVDENVPEILASRTSYHDAYGRIYDWKELYRTCYGLDEEQIRRAGAMWGEAQLKNTRCSDIFPGIAEILAAFSHIPMGICSQNGAEIILRSLHSHGIEKYFGSIIGYDDVPFDGQKPAPDAFFACLDRLGISERNRRFVYIGDHSVDVAFGKNAESVLKKDFPKAEVICVAIHHPGLYSEDDPRFLPDFTANNSEELFAVLKKLDEE